MIDGLLKPGAYCYDVATESASALETDMSDFPSDADFIIRQADNRYNVRSALSLPSIKIIQQTTTWSQYLDICHWEVACMFSLPKCWYRDYTTTSSDIGIETIQQLPVTLE